MLKRRGFLLEQRMLKVQFSPEVANYIQTLLIERPIKEAGAIHADFVRQCMAEQERLNDKKHRGKSAR